MLRRSTSLLQHRLPARPGPTLHGWGRTEQKRRLEYETVDTKYGKRQFSKDAWDVAGVEQRYSDYTQMRTYFSIGGRWGQWIYNCSQVWLSSGLIITMIIIGSDAWTKRYDRWYRRAAWW